MERRYRRPLLDQDQAARGLAGDAVSGQQRRTGRVLRGAETEVAPAVAAGDEAHRALAERARAVEQDDAVALEIGPRHTLRRYGKNTRTPNRTVRGQPIERTGVRATS